MVRLWPGGVGLLRIAHVCIQGRRALAPLLRHTHSFMTSDCRRLPGELIVQQGEGNCLELAALAR